MFRINDELLADIDVGLLLWWADPWVDPFALIHHKAPSRIMKLAPIILCLASLDTAQTSASTSVRALVWVRRGDGSPRQAAMTRARIPLLWPPPKTHPME